MSIASFDSYDEFINYVAETLQRSNLNDKIPLFIKAAEARLKAVVNTMPQQVAYPYAMYPAAGSHVLELPSDFSSLIRATYGGRALTYIAPDQQDICRMREEVYEYTIIGDEIILQTFVDGSRELALYYYRELQGLSEAYPSNWLLEDYPNVYLYAVMLEATLFLGDDERLSVWQGFLGEALQEVQDNARQTQTPSRSKLTITRS